MDALLSDHKQVILYELLVEHELNFVRTSMAKCYMDQFAMDMCATARLSLQPVEGRITYAARKRRV